MNWEQTLTEMGAFWFHDGNPFRPYARLTSGKISNGYFNGGILAEQPWVLRKALFSLQSPAGSFLARENLRVVGAAMGAIPMACVLADILSAKFAYAEKTEGGDLAFKRFSLGEQEDILLVEDTITTGGTVERLKQACGKASPDAAFGCVLALCNRSGLQEIGGLPVYSLIDKPMQTWDEGQNPFTKDGREPHPPLRPKEHWLELTRSYD